MVVKETVVHSVQDVVLDVQIHVLEAVKVVMDAKAVAVLVV